MILEFSAKIEILIDLSGECFTSPEEFLCALEEALEAGTLTMDEVHSLIADLNHRY